MQGKLFADVEELYLTHTGKPYRSHYPLNYSWYLNAYVNGEPGSEQIENDPEHELVGTPETTYDVWLDIVALSPSLYVYVTNADTWYFEGDRIHLSNVPYHHVHVDYWVLAADYDENDLIYAVYRLVDEQDRYEPSADFAVVFNRSVPGDFASDGHIDLQDYVQMAAAMTGPGTSQPDAELADVDYDGDDDVDLRDAAQFLRCFSGPDEHPDPRCAE